MIQAAIAALVIGLTQRHVPAGAPTHVWPYVLGAYAALASVVPWTTGGYLDGELKLPYSILVGLFVSLPMWGAWRWLSDGPYHALATGAHVLLYLTAAHPLAAILLWIRAKAAKVNA